MRSIITSHPEKQTNRPARDSYTQTRKAHSHRHVPTRVRLRHKKIVPALDVSIVGHDQRLAPDLEQELLARRCWCHR